MKNSQGVGAPIVTTGDSGFGLLASEGSMEEGERQKRYSEFNQTYCPHSVTRTGGVTSTGRYRYRTGQV